MENIGFEVGAPILALGLMLGIGERRIRWLIVGALVVPLGVWLLAEQVLNRNLL